MTKSQGKHMSNTEPTIEMVPATDRIGDFGSFAAKRLIELKDIELEN